MSEIAIHLGILDKAGTPQLDPEEVTDEYIQSISIPTRAFLVLCSSELEEYVEARCLAFLSDCVKGADERLQHNCLHALSIHFRSNIGKLLDSGGFYVDFYSTVQQARRYARDIDAARKKAASSKTSSSGDSENVSDPPILNKKTLTAKLCTWYSEDVVASSHGISDSDLVGLLAPLGFSASLVRDQCGTLCAALQSLAAARGEAAHRSALSSGWPFTALPTPLSQQLSLRDTWERWQSVVDSIHEFEALLQGNAESETEC
ncbi:hypothetical protein KV205_03545 [Streptomyces sp. SKN60]|uniref:hypothetical protein n=1 Tax=Streptomyces sp. SKN60 TaxID=2855506 RepID=UPI0022479900|nr:hypothetical protein [Streptomyces sp. SKN60]MCX2179608.1 hypothetical protein [Streptomyces sp. SKN60]